MRGIRVALTIAVAGSVLIAPVALARDPISSGGDDPSIQRPLTSAEQAANAWKDSQAAALDSRLHG